MDTGKLKLIGMAAFLVGLSACQTTSSATKLDTPDARVAQKLVSKLCVFGTGLDGRVSHDSYFKKSDESAFTIRSVSKGEEDWWKIGYIWRNNYWYFFINQNKDLAYCGDDSFRKNGHHFRKVKETISDDAMTNAFNNSGNSNSQSGQTDEVICRKSLHDTETKWDLNTFTYASVNEAKKRNLSPESCATLLDRSSVITTPSSSPSNTDESAAPEERLEALKSLLEKGLITKDEAATKRKAILDSM